MTYKASIKSKRNGTKSKAMIESEDEGDTGDAEPDERSKAKKASPPPTKRTKRDKQEEYVDEGEKNTSSAHIACRSYILLKIYLVKTRRR